MAQEPYISPPPRSHSTTNHRSESRRIGRSQFNRPFIGFLRLNRLPSFVFFAQHRDVVERGGAILEGGGDDLHHLLQHLCQSRQELPQGAPQDRSPRPRKGSLLPLRLEGRQAPQASASLGQYTRMRAYVGAPLLG